MSASLPHVADRLFGRPHAIEPVALQAIVEGPAGRRILSGEPIEAKGKGKKSRDFRGDRLAVLADAVTIASRDGLVQYALTPDGIAIIPVAGVLTQKFDWLAALCGWTTYDAIKATLAAAMEDYRVSAILLDVDSPGGEASGMLDISDAIIAARQIKPIWSVANSCAASAAYGIAGSASRLVLPRLAQVGSIGCVIVHVDQSAADKSQGLKYSAVYSGTHKIDGWGHAPLSESARASAQHDVDYVRAAFASLVGRQGRMSSAAALETEAAMFTDDVAVTAGLADEVMTFDEALKALSDFANPNAKGNSMNTQRLQASTALTHPAAAAAAPKDPLAPAANAAPAKPAAEAASAAESAAAAVPHAMSAPGPGEKCELCGQTRAEDGADQEEYVAETGAPPRHAHNPAPAKVYSLEDATETAQLCQIAQAPQLASGFIASKTPIAKVRSTLAQRASDAADADHIDSTTPPGGSAEASVAAQWDEVVGKVNAEQARARGR